MKPLSDCMDLEAELAYVEGRMFSPEQAANYFEHKARIAAKRHQDRVSLDLLLEASSIYSVLGEPRKQAECLDWAGKSAHFLREYVQKAELKERSGELYEAAGHNEKEAAYSYLWAADTLILMSDNYQHAEKIHLLMAKGTELLEKSAPGAVNGFLRKLFRLYGEFKEDNPPKKDSDSQQTDS
ncbi:hypothetical protein ACFL96_12200 [Thermoproteota archaeon]